MKREVSDIASVPIAKTDGQRKVEQGGMLVTGAVVAVPVLLGLWTLIHDLDSEYNLAWECAAVQVLLLPVACVLFCAEGILRYRNGSRHNLTCVSLFGGVFLLQGLQVLGAKSAPEATWRAGGAVIGLLAALVLAAALDPWAKASAVPAERWIDRVLKILMIDGPAVYGMWTVMLDVMHAHRWGFVLSLAQVAVPGLLGIAMWLHDRRKYQDWARADAITLSYRLWVALGFLQALQVLSAHTAPTAAGRAAGVVIGLGVGAVLMRSWKLFVYGDS